jgi:hypothetical protein
MAHLAANFVEVLGGDVPLLEELVFLDKGNYLIEVLLVSCLGVFLEQMYNGL